MRDLGSDWRAPLALGSLVVTLAVGGCGSTGEPVDDRVEVRTAPTVETAASATVTPVEVASATPSPTITPSETLVARPTWTPRPTVPPGEESAYWNEAVATNFGCELPCWWGMVPGSATWQDVSAVYRPIGWGDIPLGRSPRMKRHNFSVPYGDEVFGPIYLNFLEKDGVIWGIDARFSEMNGALLRDEPGLVEALRRYSLPEVVSRLGDPQQILIGIENEPVEEGVYWTYAMWLDYSGRGVAIYYLVDTITPLDDAGAFRVCPRLGGIEKIDLYMRAADGTHTLVEMTEGSADISRQLAEGDLRDSEAATGLSAGQFAYTLRTQGDDACFDARLS